MVPVLVTGLAALALDLCSKWLVARRLAPYESVAVIPGFFRLTHVRNPGAAFGLLAHQRWLFVAVGLVAIAAILYWAGRPAGRQGQAPYALGLLLGGAGGNLADRLRSGKVVDFLDFSWHQWHYPVFNLADVAILTGVGLLILHLARESRRS